jgi:hypothetical protein
MYSFKNFPIDFNENGKIFEKYVVFHKEPTKEELDNLPLTKVFYDCNEKLPKYIKDCKITHLIFGEKFNQLINNLPLGLLYLKFGYYFNQPINENILPNSLTHLIFGYEFNQTININVLSNSLTHLTFGYNFNQLINENILPNSLKEIIIEQYQQKLLFLDNKFKNIIKITFSVN